MQEAQQLRSGLVEVGTTSYTVRQEAYKFGTDDLVAEATIVIVAINRDGKSVPVPEERMTAIPRWPRGG